MGVKLFGVDIQAEIGGAMTPSDLPNFLLRKKVTGVRDPVLLSGGTNNSTPDDYDCHGMITEYTSDEMLNAPLVAKGDKRVVVIAKPLADAGVEPEMDDFIVDGDQIYTIMNVGTNSAKAVWICQCRG